METDIDASKGHGMTPSHMEARIVRNGDLHPCKTAFIDAHTLGSDQKENFTIIGGGFSESPDQHLHIAILLVPHGRADIANFPRFSTPNSATR